MKTKTKTHKLVKSKSKPDIDAADGKWIESATKHKGRLRKYLTKHYGLKPDQKITNKLLNQAKSETKDPTVLHEINLAKTLKKMHKPTKSKEASSWADGGGIQAISSRLSLAGVKHVVVMASTETA
jgi:spore germination cell wall hydrolase CwlJ-like protein